MILKKLFVELTVSQSVGHIEIIVTKNITLVIRQLKPLNSSDKQIWQSYADKHHWQVYSDNGKGLDNSVVNRIFDPFVTTKRGQGGSGLGMNIVYNLVDAKLGGTIKCLDAEQGCIFEVKVPIKNKEG